MPMPPGHAVAGYIMGAATQPLVFAAGMFFLGALVAGAAGVQLPRWAFASAVLLIFAMFVWVVSVYSSLGGRTGGGIMAAMIMIPWFTQGFVLSLLPGTTVLLSPVIGQSVFDFRGSGGVSIPPTYAVAFAAQFGFATLCFIGASRQYRNPVESSFDTLLSMGFLLGWVAISLAALRAWDDFRPRGWNPGKVETTVQVVASMIAALLLAIGAVAANARERTKWRRHVALQDPYPRRRPLPIAAVIAVALVAILAIPFAPPRASFAQPRMDILLRSAAIVTIALIGLYFFFAWMYSIMKNAAFPAAMWIALTWLLPIAIDIADYTVNGSGDASNAIGRFSGGSPIGALMKLWTQRDLDINIGIGVQILFAIISMCLWLIRFRTRPAAAEMAAGYKPAPLR
jgi:hypothetical protein